MQATYYMVYNPSKNEILEFRAFGSGIEIFIKALSAYKGYTYLGVL